MNDPIISISTSVKGKGGIGIIRVSFGSKEFIVKKFFKFLFKKKFFFPRLATFSKIFYKKKEIENGIIIYYPSPNSFNGESIIEIQIHNNIMIMNFIIKKCIKKFKKYKLRLAKPGEYIKRAFENHKIDIFDLKKINDIINLKKIKKINIKNKKNYKKVLNSIFNIRLYMENVINFKFNEKINLKLIENKFFFIYCLLKKIYFKDYFSFKIFKKKITISIIGPCNTGKSTLYNKILKYERSIVTKKTGTTRDFIKEEFLINKKKYQIIDTAGIRKTNKKLEIIGILKSIKIIKFSDIILLIEDIKEKFSLRKKIINNKKKKIIFIKNKIEKFNNKKKINKKNYFFSFKNNFNISRLLEIIKEKEKKLNISKKNKVNTYFKKKIKKCIFYIKKIIKFLKKGKFSIEIFCIYLKEIQNIFEDILCLKKKNISNFIFKNFCIGK